MHSSGPVGRHRQLVLVLEGELYLVPFALLKGSASNEYLYERFTLIAVPAVRSLGPHSKVTLPDSGVSRAASGPGHNSYGVVSASVVLKILIFSLLLTYNSLKRQDQFRGKGTNF